jgi:hypothetical protein
MLFWNSKTPLKVRWSLSTEWGELVPHGKRNCKFLQGPLDKLLFFLTFCSILIEFQIERSINPT